MGEGFFDTGFTFAWPWLLALAPLPWILRALLPEHEGGGRQALRVPWYEAVSGGATGGLRRPVLAALAAIVWLLLVVASARPQWIGEIQDLPITGRDLLLAVDISGSMDTQDMVWENRSVHPDGFLCDENGDPIAFETTTPDFVDLDQDLDQDRDTGVRAQGTGPGPGAGSGPGSESRHRVTP